MPYPLRVLSFLARGVRIRRNLVAVFVALALGLGGVLVTAAPPAMAYNPCTGDFPPPTCPTKPPPPHTLVSFPTNLHVVTFGASTTIAWNDTSTNETGFEVFRWNQNGSPGGWSAMPSPAADFSIPAHAGTGPMSFTDTGLNPNGAYSYAIRADGSGRTLESSETALVNAPGTPAMSTLNSVVWQTQSPGMGAGWLQLTWTNNAQYVTGFRVRRALGGGSWFTVSTVAAVAPGATQSFADPMSLNSDSLVDCYYITAYNGTGSADSNTICVTLVPPPPPQPLAQVTGLKGVVSGTTVTWTWHDLPGAGQYRVHLIDDTNSYGSRDIVFLNRQAFTTYTTGGLNPDHTYELDVQTRADGYTDTAATIAKVTIPTTPTPPAPTGFSHAAIYNCADRGDLEVWLNVNGGWVDEGAAPAPGPIAFCGPRYTAPKTINLHTGPNSIELTAAGQVPGSFNIAESVTIPGDSTGPTYTWQLNS